MYNFTKFKKWLGSTFLMLLSVVSYTFAQSIVINTETAGLYINQQISVDYDATDFPDPGTTYYLVIDQNNNGIFDEGDDVIASRTPATGVIQGNWPVFGAGLNVRIFAGGAGTIGERISNSNMNGALFTPLGTGNANFAFTMDGNGADNVDRIVTTNSQNFSIDPSDPDNRKTLRVDVDASAVTGANPLVFEYDIDGADAWTALSDINGDDEFFNFTGELVFALTATQNVADVRFRVRQVDADALLTADENWVLNNINVITYTGTFVQYGEQFVNTYNVSAPEVSANVFNIGTFVGETVDVDYQAFGFVGGATFILYSGDLFDIEDRVIYDNNTLADDVMEGEIPFNVGGQVVDFNLAGVYGNFNTPRIVYENFNLSTDGTGNTDYNFFFNQAGLRRVTTTGVDIDGETHARLIFGLNTTGIGSAVDAVALQYSTDGTTWVNMLDEADEEIEYFGENTTYEVSLSGAVLSANTRFRLRQKNTALGGGAQTWTLSSMQVDLMELVDSDNFDNQFISNYDITVTSIEDEDENVITGGSAYAGQVITVFATAAGFDANDEDYAVIINNTYVLLDATVEITGTTDIEITGTIPPYAEYVNAADIEVKIFRDGAEALVGVTGDLFADFDVEEDTEITGGEFVGGTVDFTEAGDRSIVTPGFRIPSNEDLVINLGLQRINAAGSPTGTEIVFEYSTNNGDTYTEIGQRTLAQAGANGNNFEFTGLTASIASMNTIFRVRQVGNNGVGLDSWRLTALNFSGGSNLYEPEHVDYNGSSLDVLEPLITLEQIDDSSVDLYPGANMTVEFSIEGAFPAGTMFELIRETDIRDISIATFSAAGSESVLVPAFVGDNYELFIRASYRDVESNTIVVLIQNNELTITEITSTSAVEDGDQFTIFPGNEFTVNFTTEGNIGAGTNTNIEVYDYNPDVDDWVLIGTKTGVDGSITATLPVGVDYGGGNNADIRLTLTNGNLIAYEVPVNTTWFTNEATSSQYFPVADRTGYTSNNYFYTGSDARSATSVPFDLTNGGRFQLDVVVLTGWFTADDEVLLQYTIDDGETWVTVEEHTFVSDNVQFFPDFIDVPEEAWSDNFRIRFITNQTGIANGLQNIIYLRGLTVQALSSSPIAELETDLNTYDFNVRYPSVGLSVLDDTNFNLGEQVEVEYNVDGPFGADVHFAVVMKQGDAYRVLASGNETGNVQKTVNIPTIPFFDDPDNPDFNYDLQVIPFTMESAGDMYRGPSQTYNLNEEEDWGTITGRDGGGGFASFTFNQEGSRWISTAAYDLSGEDAGRLNFTFNWNEGSFVRNNQVLPRLEVSTDGGATYQALEVTGSAYEESNWIFPSGSFEVELPASALADNVVFRWRQPLNLGNGEDVWTISAVSISVGETNELAEAIYTRFNNPQAISVNEPAAGNYTWEQADMNEPVFNGDTFDYSFNFNEDLIDENQFPAGTEFTFYLDVVNPETGRNHVLGTATTLGTHTSLAVPSNLSAGRYDVFISAQITVGDDTYVFFEEEDNVWIGELDIFLQVVRTVYKNDPNATLYAGNMVTIGVEIENDETAADNDFYNSLYYNLILENAFGGEDYVIATRQGLTGDFEVQMPPFFRGPNAQLRVKASQGSALGQAGTFINVGRIENLTDAGSATEDFINLSEFANSAGGGAGPFSFRNDVNGFRQIITKDLSIEEATVIEFTVSFDEVAANLTADQYLNFEYSTDNGATYSTLASFPRMIDVDPLVNENVRYAIPAAAADSPIRFRWRQNERKGNISVNNINILYTPEFPFQTIAHTQAVSPQNIQVVDFSVNEVCFDTDFDVNFEIKGRFGENAMARLEFIDQNNNTTTTSYVYDVPLADAGTFAGKLLREFFGTNSNNFFNRNMRVRARVMDETFDNLVYDNAGNTVSLGNIQGTYSPVTVEVVAPIRTFVDWDVDNQQLCNPTDIMVYIYNSQQYFTYQVVRADNGDPVGSPITSENGGFIEVNIGQLSETTELAIQISSGSTSGAVSCNTLMADDNETVNLNRIYELYRFSGVSTTWVRSESESRTVCGGSGVVQLSARRINDAGNQEAAGAALVTWFRDNEQNQISTNATISTQITQSGNYFARIIDGDCEYFTNPIAITVLEVAPQPTITVVSGDLVTCEEESPVVLTGPTGYEFYEWRRNGNVLAVSSNEITVELDGSYDLRVSNYPFGGTSTACAASPTSVAVVLSRYTAPVYRVTRFTGTYVDLDATADQFGCESFVAYFRNESNSANVTLNGVVIRDGVQVASFANRTNYTFEQSGDYQFVYVSNDAPEDACEVVSETYSVIIGEQPEQPTIQITSANTVCQGSSAVLEAPAGYEYYRWYRAVGLTGGFNVLSNNSRILETNTQLAANDYTYAVEVSDLPFGQGCVSPLSNRARVTVLGNPEDVILQANGTANGTVNQSDLFSEPIVICGAGNGSLTIVGNQPTNYQWLLEGNPVASANTGSSIVLTQGGNYSLRGFNIANGVTCEFTTANIQVIIEAIPDTPEVTANGPLEICEGDNSLVLTATTAGFSEFYWERANIGTAGWGQTGVPQGQTDNSSINVNLSGHYRVYGITANGCWSEESARITVVVNTLPTDPAGNFIAFANNLCGPGQAEFRVANSNADWTYQLVDAVTEQASGTAVRGTGNTISLFSATITHNVNTQFKLRMTNGAGCSFVGTTVRTANMRTIELTVVGNRITRELSSTAGASTQWFRNGQPMINGGTGASIVIFDDAEYSVEVTYTDGCVLTASTANLVLNIADAVGIFNAEVYPNPTNEKAFVKISGEYQGKVSLRLMTLTGQLLMEEVVDKFGSELSHEINLSNLQQGIYNLQLTRDGINENMRIIKK